MPRLQTCSEVPADVHFRTFQVVSRLHFGIYWSVSILLWITNTLLPIFVDQVLLISSG